ncbi:MAG: hypothetical protein KJZ72_21480, partial [Anaerolineales bacterium]|nr:hypothetical protein [Anaerolineales bacterium]
GAGRTGWLDGFAVPAPAQVSPSGTMSQTVSPPFFKTMIMNSYFTSNRILISKTTLLASGSVVLGIMIGVLAYLLSVHIYYIFVYPLVVGGVTLIVYYKWLQFVKIRHSVLMTSIGLITGIIVAMTFYVSPYVIGRNEFIIDLQKRHSFIDAQTASFIYDKVLSNATGSNGFVGYMKSRAQVSPWTDWIWAYWLSEVVLISTPVTWIGYKFGKQRSYEVQK